MNEYIPKKLEVIDETTQEKKKEAEENTKPLPEEFGRNLDTLEKARLWLTNPNNWHESRLYILKWDGLRCTVSRDHGERLRREPWDDGLPWAAMHGQKRRRASSGSLEPFSEPEVPAEDSY